MNHADPSAAYLDPTHGRPRIDLWGLLDSACCVVGSAYVSWRIATGAHGVVATTVINAYAAVYAALANYFDDGRGVRLEPLESLVSRMTRLACQGGRRVLEGKMSRAVRSVDDRRRADAVSSG
jgi:hypothetical protein